MKTKPKTFFFMPYIPYPVDRGTYQRVYHLFVETSKAFDIDLVCLQEEAGRDMSPFEPFTNRRLAIPFKNPPWKRLFPARILEPLPATVVHWKSPDVLDALKHFVGEIKYEYVVFIDLVLWPYIKELFPKHPKLIMDRSRVDWLFQTEELKTLSLSLKDRVLRRENLLKIARLEKQVYKQLSGMIVCGWDDKTFLNKRLGDSSKVFVLPNGYNETYFNYQLHQRSLTKYPSVLFCGALDYSPNVDAINWFAKDIWPRIRKKEPHAVWTIIGKSPGEDLGYLKRMDGVEFVGEVPDVRPYYQSRWVQVVPLRIGGGTRLKIVESLGMKCPVVSTSLGAQGLNLSHQKDIILADTEEAFAQEILRLLNSPEVRNRLEINGLNTVLNEYRWEQLGNQLNQYIHSL